MSRRMEPSRKCYRAAFARRFDLWRHYQMRHLIRLVARLSRLAPYHAHRSAHV